ncbi:MAG TPA: response regulator [Gemmatimonadaceae bacterium]
MKRRALVVDDDRSLVKTLSDVLALKGWDVTTATNGTAAVNAVAQGAFDIVLMDFKMPGMDGMSAFKAIKALRPTMRVVLMSAYLAHDVVAEAEREGVMRVMSKPVDLSVLLQLLATSLTRQRPILLIDSDAAFLRSLADVLALRGFDAVTASSLDQAVRILAERTPAAVLLHLHLGDQHEARETVAKLHATAPAAALVVYSGQPGTRAEALEGLQPDWVYAYLQKPFAVEQITGVLNGIAAG